MHTKQAGWSQTVEISSSPKLYTWANSSPNMACMLWPNLVWCTHAAVPGRNQTLFRCIFRSHYCVQSAVAQKFRYGRGSYALCKLGKYWWVYLARMSPTLNGSSMLERFERSNASEIHNGIMFDFYPGLPHMYIQVHTSVVPCTPAYIYMYLNGSSRKALKLPHQSLG